MHRDDSLRYEERSICPEFKELFGTVLVNPAMVWGKRSVEAKVRWCKRERER